MIIRKSPGAVAALGASATDQLGGRSNRKLIANNDLGQARPLHRVSLRSRGIIVRQTGGRAMTAPSTLGSQRQTASVSDAQAQGRVAQQRYADLLAAEEFQRIARFAAACRRQWPGAMIVLRPDGAQTGASAPPA